ncbi:translation initiation factor IF-2-like [Choloepus didactylus]|uniref:translation initiation factor IF-2-like n=1 Tax=Choloepus didactylus TaxID=27675 RepID=UPI00189E6BC8|nr:translation initiation factor IF-2-like [Choloepus didactylus]
MAGWTGASAKGHRILPPGASGHSGCSSFMCAPLTVLSVTRPVRTHTLHGGFCVPRAGRRCWDATGTLPPCEIPRTSPGSHFELLPTSWECCLTPELALPRAQHPLGLLCQYCDLEMLLLGAEAFECPDPRPPWVWLCSSLHSGLAEAPRDTPSPALGGMQALSSLSGSAKCARSADPVVRPPENGYDLAQLSPAVAPTSLPHEMRLGLYGRRGCSPWGQASAAIREPLALAGVSSALFQGGGAAAGRQAPGRGAADWQAGAVLRPRRVPQRMWGEPRAPWTRGWRKAHLARRAEAAAGAVSCRRAPAPAPQELPQPPTGEASRNQREALGLRAVSAGRALQAGASAGPGGSPPRPPEHPGRLGPRGRRPRTPPAPPRPRPAGTTTAPDAPLGTDPRPGLCPASPRTCVSVPPRARAPLSEEVSARDPAPALRAPRAPHSPQGRQARPGTPRQLHSGCSEAVPVWSAPGNGGLGGQSRGGEAAGIQGQARGEARSRRGSQPRTPHPGEQLRPRTPRFWTFSLKPVTSELPLLQPTHW